MSGPQGLKAALFMVLSGTAEAVPFPKTYPESFMRPVLVHRPDSSSAYRPVRSLSSETRLDHSGKQRAGGWRWRRDVYIAPDSSEHVQDLQRVVWRRPPSFRGRGVAGTRGIGGAQQGSGVSRRTAACAAGRVVEVRL